MKEYKLSEIQIGTKESFTRKITSEMEESFRNISGDINPLHFDDAFASEISEGKLDSHISFGMLTASLLSTLGGVYLPGKYCLIHSVEQISFMNPVYVNDELTVEGEVIDKDDPLKLITVKVLIKNQNNKKVLKAKMKMLVMK